MARATTFGNRSAAEMRAIGAGEIAGEFYPRYGHRNGRLFESKIAELEGADGAVSFASGMAALYGIFATFLAPGDRLAA
ncbi:MAG: PLP-dependent transferase, partial [Gemmatimonadetes bacterium]|nr:PLP-dependent transferase [Gemmatimonadota bacterium]